MWNLRSPLSWSLGLLLAVFAVGMTGCSKQHDDCAKPKDPQATSAGATTRDVSLSGNEDQPSIGRPGMTYRNGNVLSSGDEGTISDDGNDEADSEGNNKKSRGPH